jgi:hypothetical protein
MISIIAANAGLAMNTPTDAPRIVVRANPFSNPAPANISGSIATNKVE